MSTQAPISASRKRQFTIIAIVLPIVLLVLLEIILRAANYGDQLPLFRTFEGNEEYLVLNPRVSERYFSDPKLAPKGLFDLFAKEKGEETIRLFVMGGSSAAGFPYGHGGAFSRILEQMLWDAHPDKDIEVINTAMPAINSYTLLDFTDEILAEKPDAVLIYAGHNEYYGALGTASTQTAGSSRFLVKTYMSLRKLRLFQLVQNTVRSIRGSGDVDYGEEETLMEVVASKQQIPLGGALYEKGLSQYSENLEEIIEKFRSSGTPVFLGDLVSNEADFPPFASDDTAAVESQAAWQFEQGQRKVAEARSLFGPSRNRLFEDARKHFRLAKDLDLIKFRAPSSFDEVVKNQWSKDGVYPVEVKSRFRQESTGMLVGNNWITEHLHPNTGGYTLMAARFFESLQEHFFHAPEVMAYDRAIEYLYVTELDSAFARLSLNRLQQRWPFVETNSKVDSVSMNFSATSTIDQMAFSRYKLKSNWLETNNQTFNYYFSRRNYRQAFHAAASLSQEFDLETQPKEMMGTTLLSMGRSAKASRVFQDLWESSKDEKALFLLIEALIASGEIEQARDFAQKAIAESSDPNAQGVYDLLVRYLELRDSDRDEKEEGEFIELQERLGINL